MMRFQYYRDNNYDKNIIIIIGKTYCNHGQAMFLSD